MGSLFLTFSPANFFPPLLIQSSAATLEWNMAIITFYLGWARLLALTFPLLLGNDGWLLRERLADWRIGGRVGCCCKGRTRVEFFISPFSYLTQQNSYRYTIVHFRLLHIAYINYIMSGSLHSFGCGPLHKECGKRLVEFSSTKQGKNKETYAVLMRADVGQKTVLMRGLCHFYCRRLWKVQIPSSWCT